MPFVGSLILSTSCELGGQKFASDTEEQLGLIVGQWFGQQPASFLASSIQKLADWWYKCLNELGRLMFNI